jgi:hypothetical protein
LRTLPETGPFQGSREFHEFHEVFRGPAKASREDSCHYWPLLQNRLDSHSGYAQ